MRVTSDFFVSSLVRRCFAEDAYATVLARGAREAGAIFLIVDRRDGRNDLYTPAPQSLFDDATSGARLFERRLSEAAREAVDAVIASERRMDPDIWIVEIEDREGRTFWDVAQD